MRFLLDKKELIRGCIAHINAGLGCGADYVAKYDKLYAPFDTKIEKEYYGKQGGNWIWFNDNKGNSIQCAHLDKFYVPVGANVAEGQIIALTGNTGEITTGPHLHVQIVSSDGKRIDPEIYFNLNIGQVMYKKALNYNREIYKGILGDGGREPTVLRLSVKSKTTDWKGKTKDVSERALLRKFGENDYRIRRDVSINEFVESGAGEAVPVKLEDVIGIPEF